MEKTSKDRALQSGGKQNAFSFIAVSKIFSIYHRRLAFRLRPVANVRQNNFYAFHRAMPKMRSRSPLPSPPAPPLPPLFSHHAPFTAPSPPPHPVLLSPLLPPPAKTPYLPSHPSPHRLPSRPTQPPDDPPVPTAPLPNHATRVTYKNIFPLSPTSRDLASLLLVRWHPVTPSTPPTQPVHPPEAPPRPCGSVARTVSSGPRSAATAAPRSLRSASRP